MLRPLGVAITGLVALGSCGGGQQPTASTPTGSAPQAADESSAPKVIALQPEADSTPEEQDQPAEPETACETLSTSVECKCERGDTDACLKVTDAAFRRRDHDMAIIKTYSMCQRGIAEACFRAAHYMKNLRIQQRFGNSPPELEDKAVAIHKEGCAKGDAAACFGYGKLLLSGTYVAADSALGLQHLETSCTGGHARACSFLASAYETGLNGLKKDKKRALQLLETSCDSGGVASCTYLGDTIARKDRAKAHALYDKSCDADDARGCARLGRVHLKAAKFNDAYTIFVKACELEDSGSCVDAGSLSEAGKGTTKDPAKARELYKVACEEDFAAGCLSLAIMVSKGVGGRRHWGHAVELADKACSLDPKTCKQTARLKRNPPDWQCDNEVACEALCNEHIARSCTRLGELLADKETAPLVKAQVGKPEPDDGWRWPSCDDANAAYRRGCEQGDGVGCLRIGKYAQACDAGSADGCVMLESAEYDSAEAPERKKVFRELSKACTRRKSGPVCIQVLQRIKRDAPARAKRLVERWCRAGNGAACAAQADLIYVQNYGIGDGSCEVVQGNRVWTQERCSDKQRLAAAKRNEAAQREKAKLLRRACQLGDVDSCFHGDFPPDLAQKMADDGFELLRTQSCGRGGL